MTLLSELSLPLRMLPLLFVLATGCATTENRDPRDPLEPMNRAIFRFNEVADEWVAVPVATAYRNVLHVEIRNRIRNFFSNLGDLWIGVNDVLQGKFFDGFASGLTILGAHSSIGMGDQMGRWEEANISSRRRSTISLTPLAVDG